MVAGVDVHVSDASTARGAFPSVHFLFAVFQGDDEAFGYDGVVVWFLEVSEEALLLLFAAREANGVRHDDQIACWNCQGEGQEQ